MEWAEVIDNPYLKDLPFKIELDKYGNIVMSPASNGHGDIQASIAGTFKVRLKGGKPQTECSVQTSDGVKVADVVWKSDAFVQKYGKITPYQEAPEICVEIISPSNSTEELRLKVDLFLARGAKEVWLVNEDNKIRYFTHTGEIQKSNFLSNVDL